MEHYILPYFERSYLSEVEERSILFVSGTSDEKSFLTLSPILVQLNKMVNGIKINK